MKFFFTLLAAAFLFSSSSYCSDTTEIIPDSTSAEKAFFQMVVTGGVGSMLFSLGPAYALGVEIPFTRSHKVSFEIYGYQWFKKLNETTSGYNDSRYIKLSDNFYSMIYFCGTFKYYFAPITSRTRINLHLGPMFGVKKHSINSWDIGFGINHALNDRSFLNLTARLFPGEINIGGGSYAPPSIIMLNYSHRFNL